MSARRTLDVTLSLLGLLGLAPVLLLIAFLVWARSGRPILYAARRIGENGRPFRLYKFRTMVVGADSTGALTTKGDTRVTPVGRVLRRYKLDEFPQLFNVLRGDMTLVGPRPEDPKYFALATPVQREVLRRRPGITSAASLQYRSEEDLIEGPLWEERYLREILPSKLRMELASGTGESLAGDFGLLLRTLFVLTRGAVGKGGCR